MAKIKFFKVAGIVLCTMLFFSSCKMLFPFRKKGLNTMTMTTAKEGEVTISLAGTGMITIDWGDGTPPETHTLVEHEGNSIHTDNYKHIYIHNYSETSVHTITITGKNIMRLECKNNKLTKLDVSKNSALTHLSCWSNQLTELDVSKNSVLTYLECAYNQLIELDLSKNSAMTQFVCAGNQLTELDVSKNSAMTRLACAGNQLTELDVSGAIALRYLLCSDNLLEAPALNRLFGTLPNNPTPQKPTPIFIRGNPGTDTCDRSIVTNKGWVGYW